MKATRRGCARKASAAAVRLTGEARSGGGSCGRRREGRSVQQGIDAVGAGGYTAIQLATILGENNVKLVPDIAVSGDGSGGLVNAMVAKMLAGNGWLQKSGWAGAAPARALASLGRGPFGQGARRAFAGERDGPPPAAERRDAAAPERSEGLAGRRPAPVPAGNSPATTSVYVLRRPLSMRPALTRLSRSAAVALLLLGVPTLSSAASKETERVEKTVTFSPGGTLKLKNFSGNVEITGEDRADISLVAVRTATRDRLDHVKLDIQTSGDTVTIDANKRDDDWEHHDDNVVDTAFTIKVPKNANLDVDVFSSAVSVAGVSGRHHVHGFSSELSVTAAPGRLTPRPSAAPSMWRRRRGKRDQTLRAKTFSGDIEVTLPAAATGSVEFDSFSGDMSSSVPMLFQSKSKRSLPCAARVGPNRSCSFHTLAEMCG